LVGAAHRLLPDSAASISLSYSWHKTKANRLMVKTPHVICFIFKKCRPTSKTDGRPFLTVQYVGAQHLVEKVTWFYSTIISPGYLIFLNRFPMDSIKASLGVYLPFLLRLLGGISRNEVIHNRASTRRRRRYESRGGKTHAPPNTHDVWTLNFHECTKINCGGNSHRNWWKVKHNFTHAHTGQKTRPIRLKVRNRLETLWGGKEGGIISKYIEKKEPGNEGEEGGKRHTQNWGGLIFWTKSHIGLVV
jgi:hypothetical protein